MNFNRFLDNLFRDFKKFGIDVEGLEIDHMGYQASSDEDYDNLEKRFLSLGGRVHESLVGGRRVSVYELHSPIVYQSYSIPALELIAPKTGQICPSALEHVEFVISEPFGTFMDKYPNLDWDRSSIKQPIFPMIKLRLDKFIQVKFHHKPVLEIVKSINKATS